MPLLVMAPHDLYVAIMAHCIIGDHMRKMIYGILLLVSCVGSFQQSIIQDSFTYGLSFCGPHHWSHNNDMSLIEAYLVLPLLLASFITHGNGGLCTLVFCFIVSLWSHPAPLWRPESGGRQKALRPVSFHILWLILASFVPCCTIVAIRPSSLPIDKSF